MINPLADQLTSDLDALDRAGLRRRLRVMDSPQQPEVLREDRRLINFSSNDYLGLANHPALKAAARDAIDRYGAGTGASRLISGTQRAHQDLEDHVAAFKQTEAALAFSTGFAAAMGTIPALVSKGDVIILDKLCHACLVDGARMSGATIRVFPHNNLEKLEHHLRWASEKFPSAKILVITESVFSMDGDRADLLEIVALKDRFGAILFLDEAHSIGVIGDHGRGLAAELGVADQIEIQMGTMGKALGASGGTIAGSRALIDFLVNRARSFIFSTAPPASSAAAASAAIGILESPEGTRLQNQLWTNIRMVQPGASSAIIPIHVGSATKAVETSTTLEHAGFWVPAVRYPTVPKGSARLRVSLSAQHTATQIQALNQALAAIDR